MFDDPMDRFSVTGNEWDHGAYRASLRNVMVSGPYMHDGHFKTIDEVLSFTIQDWSILPTLAH